MITPVVTPARLGLCLFVAAALSFSPAVWSQDEQTEDDSSLFEDVEREPVDPKDIKRNRLEKEKWEKRKYDRFLERRAENGLPAELNLASPDILARDEALRISDITSIVDLPGAKADVTQMLEEAKSFIPADLPDTNVLFSDSGVASAKAISTGQIVLNAGIMQQINSLDAITFILGHELGHIAYDHFRNEERRQQFNTIVQVATLVAKGGDASRAQRSDELIGYMVFSEALLQPGLHRGDEDTADEIAIDLIVRQGLSLEGARAVLQVLQIQEQERDAALAKRCGGKPGFGRAFGNAFGVAFGTEKPLPAECGGSGFLGLGGLFSKKQKVEDRIEDIEDYIATRYPNYPRKRLTELTPTLQRAVAKDGPLARSTYAAEALKAVQNNDLDRAIRYAIASFDPRDTVTPKPYLALYNVYKRAGRDKEARAYLTSAFEAPNAPRAVYTLELQSRIEEAQIIADDREAARVDAILTDLLARYQNDPLAALADIGPVRELEPAPMHSDAVAAYDRALSLAATAQSLFPDSQDFLLQELELLRVLERGDAYTARLARCADEEDGDLEKYCKALIKAEEAEARISAGRSETATQG